MLEKSDLDMRRVQMQGFVATLLFQVALQRLGLTGKDYEGEEIPDEAMTKLSAEFDRIAELIGYTPRHVKYLLVYRHARWTLEEFADISQALGVEIELAAHDLKNETKYVVHGKEVTNLRRHMQDELSMAFARASLVNERVNVVLDNLKVVNPEAEAQLRKELGTISLLNEGGDANEETNAVT